MGAHKAWERKGLSQSPIGEEMGPRHVTMPLADPARKRYRSSLDRGRLAGADNGRGNLNSKLSSSRHYVVDQSCPQSYHGEHILSVGFLLAARL